MANIISRLKLESGEFDSKIKRAGQELLAYSEHCRKMGLEMGYANRDAKEFAKALGSMQTVSQTARGKISELSEAFVNAKVMYKNMTDEEKKGEFGKNLAASLDQLKTRLNAAKQDLADVNKELAGGSKFGEFGNVLDTLGSKLGVTGNLTEMLTSRTAMLTGAVGAGIAIVTKATDAWAGYNSELAKQDQVTQVTTGLKGDDANRMTDTMRALSDTYKVDFRDAINAANTLMSQFGVSGDEAIRLIKDGMKGMIMGDGPKLLSMIQQYAPAFQSAGVSASQLVAVIQNSEGGIFTDQNMNAIVMGIKNIRLMTKSTSEALAKLGLDGQDMAEKMSNGSMTVFDALKMVASQLKNVDSNSQAAGEVMQTVFGRQGAMAGTNLAKAIDTLNTNLDETKNQLGDVGDAYDKLQEANERLNIAIRDAFGYDGWEQMATGIKTTLIGALSDVIEHLAIIEEGFGKIKNFFGGGNKAPAGKGYEDIEKTQQWINNGKDDNERRRRYDKAIADLQKKLNNIGKERQVRNSDGSISFVIDDAATQAIKREALQKRMRMLYATSYTPKPPKKTNEIIKPLRTVGDGNTTTTTDIKDEFTDMEELVGLIPVAEQKVKDLQQQIRESWDEGEIVKLTQNLKVAEDEVKRLKDIGKPVDLEKMFPDVGVTSGASQSFGQQIAQSINVAMAEAAQNADIQTLRTLLETQIKNGIEGVDIPADWLGEQIFGEGVNIPDEYWKNLQEQINEKLRDMGVDPIEIDFKTGKDKGKKDDKNDGKNPTVKALEKFNGNFSQVTGGIGNIANGIQQLGIELPQGIQDAVSVLTGISSIITGITSILGLILVAQQATAAASWTDAITPFANGGIVPHAANGYYVPGNSFSGDMVPALLNSGELVLNRAQQGNIASQLSGSGLQGMKLDAVITGEQIRLVLNNNGRRTGRGEYVQTKSRRV